MTLAIRTLLVTSLCARSPAPLGFHHVSELSVHRHLLGAASLASTSDSYRPVGEFRTQLDAVDRVAGRHRALSALPVLHQASALSAAPGAPAAATQCHSGQIQGRSRCPATRDGETA